MQKKAEFLNIPDNEDAGIRVKKMLSSASGANEDNGELLGFSYELARIRMLNELEDFFFKNLKNIIGFDESRIIIYNNSKGDYECLIGNGQLNSVDTRLHKLLSIILSNEETAEDLEVHAKVKAYRTSGIFTKDELKDQLDFLSVLAIKEFVVVPVNEKKTPCGAIFLFSKSEGIFSPEKLYFLNKINPHLSTAVTNVFKNEDIIKSERESSVLLALSNAIASIRNKQDLFNGIDQQLKKMFSYQDFVVCLINEDGETHSAFLYNNQEDLANNKGIAPMSSAKYSLDDGLCKVMMNAGQPVVFDVEEVMKWENTPVWMEFWYNSGIKEMIGLPVWENSVCIGFFYLFAKQRNAVSNRNYGLLEKIAKQLSIAINNIKANEKIAAQLLEINAYKQQLEGEKLYLEEQINLSGNQTELVGDSPGIKKVFYLIEQVAKSSSTVLILGETGTGKELIARAIHNNSLRKDRLMVKLNCATLPPNLIESELFGHEKGSFTGATEKRIGKFELANNGTLFLDEIGELPLDLQVKLLRVLQEKEIERIGGKTVIKTDVRIIAATNRDLAKEVQAGHFRSDLFYRLNVFPITLPPLRERKEDIAALAIHFMNKSAKKAGKNVKNISQQVMKSLAFYSWPGNIRELEHQIERCVLLTNGPTIKEIQLPKNDFKESPSTSGDFQVKTIHDNERDHILNILKLCNGKIAGVGGAASILDIPATTLNSKIKKFKIKREHTLY